MAARVGVIGSANMDLVARVERAPGPGENTRGAEFRTIPGGKGANQAVAAARLGAEVVFIGKVGDDAFGAALRAGLRAEGVNTAHLATARGAPSGTALILVDARGQNSIVICAGANGLLRPEDIRPLAGLIAGLDILVMQLEIPLDTVTAAIRLANERNVPVVLDAAPPQRDPPEEFFRVAVLTPNEAEAEALCGAPARNLRAAEAACRSFLRRGARAVVLKRGEKGALLMTPQERLRLPAHRVKVVDTTAAGDAFTGALAVYRAEGRPLADAVRLANRAGALAATRLGAQPSMPTRKELEAFVSPHLRSVRKRR